MTGTPGLNLRLSSFGVVSVWMNMDLRCSSRKSSGPRTADGAASALRPAAVIVVVAVHRLRVVAAAVAVLSVVVVVLSVVVVVLSVVAARARRPMRSEATKRCPAAAAILMSQLGIWRETRTRA